MAADRIPGGVYVSVHDLDRAAARELGSKLEAAGVAAWSDSIDAFSRQPTEAEIRDALRSVETALVLVGRFGLEHRRDFDPLQERFDQGGLRVVVATLPNAIDPKSEAQRPSFLADAPVVDVESEGLGRLVKLLMGSRPEIELSASVAGSRRRVMDRFGDSVPAGAFAQEIASIHPEYGRGLAGSLASGEIPSDSSKPADVWLQEIRGLISIVAARALHGRAVMLGLGLLDPAVRRNYEDVGFEAALVNEFREPLGDLLTSRGLLLWDREPPAGDEPRPSAREDSVPTHTDNPVSTDDLEREGIARVLSRRVRDMRAQEIITARTECRENHPCGKSFLVHLHAPWGMGKTSLLNLLKQNLARRDDLKAEESRDEWSYGPWIVIDFNAWRHQRLDPPWWWLMNALYEQGRAQLDKLDPWHSRQFRAREWAWRLWVGWPRLIVAVFVLVVVLLVLKAGWLGDLWTSRDRGRDLPGFLLALAALTAAVTTIWATVRTASRWLLTASPAGARRFVDQTRDPMETVKGRFSMLVERLAHPVLIVIDDLDRCQGQYVVRLLEGIQTLFRDEPVAYIVAADRDWLSDSYRVAYGDFASANDEPGRPLGYLFLEKTFQLTVTLPPPPADVHANFWARLLRPGENVDRRELEAARKVADAAFSRLGSEAAIRQELESTPGATPAEQRARVEAAAVQLASPVIAQEAQHALVPFAPLLDRNPRALKRLVNAYGMARGIETLAGKGFDAGRATQQTTALWTILALRWPRLADYFARHPEQVEVIGEGPAHLADVPKELAALFSDAEVRAVVMGRGDGIVVRLNEDAVRRCSGQIQV